jgi:hypothetical protein
VVPTGQASNMKTLATFLGELTDTNTNDAPGIKKWPLPKSIGKTYDGVNVLKPKTTSKNFKPSEVRKSIQKAKATNEEVLVEVEVVNDALDEASNETYPDVWTALQTVSDIVTDFGLEIPTISALESDVFGEEVFELEEDHFLYFCYSLNEAGSYDIVSCVVDEPELDEILTEDHK